MNEAQLIDWLKKQQSILDEVIADAASEFYKKHSSRYNFDYELDDCQKESFNLIQKKDLCYDRALTPFVYSLWYHARRVNTFLRFFCTAFLKNTSNKIEIFDLGAGTGAVQFSVGLILEAMQQHGLKVPKVKIINIDSSPFMLEYNEAYLWPAFLKRYPSCSLIDAEYCVNSWNTQIENASTNPWITASYLFDISDKQDLVAKDFIKATEVYKPGKLLLLSSNQDTKIEIIKKITDQIAKLQYTTHIVSLDTLPFKGPLVKCNELRLALQKKHKAFRLESPTSWNDGSFYGVYLDKKAGELDLTLSASVKQKALQQINLYNTKLHFRKDIQLSEQQQKASKFFGRQSIVIGPAGSGKSIVISEKIKNLVDQQYNYNANFKILFTPFNKGLVRKVGDWLENLLDPKKAKREYYRDFRGGVIESSFFSFSGATHNIDLLNFDLLPTRLGGIRSGNLMLEESHYTIIKNLLPLLKTDLKIGDAYDSILQPEFIFEEYHKIMYGQNIHDKESYMKVSRTGMWNRLGKNQREVIFEAVWRYMKYMETYQVDSFISMRRKLYNNLSKGALSVKYNYTFIDEFQDCTKSDFEIFNMMTEDLNAITFAGDLAQAIQIGKFANIPKDESTSRREYFYLEGSYRVPQRISECITGISEEIVKRFKGNDGAKSISPVKNSPPGARPIVVYAPTLNELANKVESIWQDYKIFNLTKFTILEKDKQLNEALKAKGLSSETETILKLKGLEKDCILWSTRIPVEDEREVFEFVYTILTRTSNILIIALSDNTHESFKRVLGFLRQDRLIFYDDITRARFSNYCEIKATELPQEEDEDDLIAF
jgi:DNA helicase II / ATP-dependent DNA helicase PcrA